MSPPPVYALASNLINQTLNSIFLLESLSLITPADAHAIRSKLPPPSGPFPSLDPPAPYSPPPPQLHQSFSNLRVGQSASYSSQSPNDNAQPPTQSGIPALPQRMPPQQEQRARALWDYSGTERDDLAFRAGDTIIIDEQVNDQWYRGRVIPQGQDYPLQNSGLFPTNYVEKLSQQSNSPSHYQPSQPQSMVPYQSPPQQYGYDQKPSMAMIHQPPPQHLQVQQQVPMQGGSMIMQQDPKKNKFGKIGNQLGNAAVNGAGFGFGSAVASELVHKIF